MWPTSSRKKVIKLTHRPLSYRKKNTQPIYYYYYNLSKSLLLQARDNFEDFCFHEKKKKFIEKIDDIF